MAPAVYLAALVQGLRGERDAFDTWWELGEKVLVSPDHAARAFTLVRLALHEGRLDEAEATLQRYESIASQVDSAPWPASGPRTTRVRVVDSRRDLGPRARARHRRASRGDATNLAEHLWAVPTSRRRDGGATGDLAAAPHGGRRVRRDWRLGFEEPLPALLPGAEGDTGRETLRALRCSLPASI